MFNSVHLLFMLKKACEDNNILVLEDTLLPVLNLKCFKTSISEFTSALESGKVSNISFFSVEPLTPVFNNGVNDYFILKCLLNVD